MKILDLVLKHQWYDLIEDGVKTEEYRELKPYWIKRLMGCLKWCSIGCLYDKNEIEHCRRRKCENLTDLKEILEGTQTIQSFRDVFYSVIQPGVALNSSLADLSAIADVTGDKLKEIEGYARDTAKTFGTDAASSVESYKLLLSQLSPELGNYPTALRAMGDNIVLLEKK